MAKSGTTSADKLDAYHLYIEGTSAREISLAYGVTEGTVERWIKDGNWQGRREKLEQEIKSSVFCNLQKKISENCLKMLEIAAHALNCCESEMEETIKSESMGEAEKETIKELLKISLDAAKLQKEALPKASEELSKFIASELSRLGKAGFLPNYFGAEE